MCMCMFVYVYIYIYIYFFDICYTIVSIINNTIQYNTIQYSGHPRGSKKYRFAKMWGGGARGSYLARGLTGISGKTCKSNIAESLLIKLRNSHVYPHNAIICYRCPLY